MWGGCGVAAAMAVMPAVVAAAAALAARQWLLMVVGGVRGVECGDFGGVVTVVPAAIGQRRLLVVLSMVRWWCSGGSDRSDN
nr:hypothetical protein [Tanacetum cinerariifolium]